MTQRSDSRSSRFSALAQDFKTYLALISAVIAALAVLTDGLSAVVGAVIDLQRLPAEFQWVVAAGASIAAIYFLTSALSRRSILAEPSRFLLSVDNPDHLIGREEEIGGLVRQCSLHSMVFLVGDSGSGKSALVRAGVIEALRGGERGPGTDLVPVLLDLSGVGWDQGLSLTLARSLNGMEDPLWQSLGGGPRPSADQVFAWLARRPAHAARRPLLIFDQFDDYLDAHRSRFYEGMTLRRSEEIEAANADWRRVAETLRQGSISALIVCRSEAAGSLPALCFVEESAIAREQLTRLAGALVPPLLDRLQGVDDRTVRDPEFGWQQLTRRLIRDLEASGDGQVLPIQLSVALNSLRLLPRLTPTYYDRVGGLRGLESLHVKRHAEKAAAAGGLAYRSLIEVLLHFVSRDGSKTKPIPRRDLASLLLDQGAVSAEQVLSRLSDDKIIRSVAGERETGENLLLYHDYLARAVRETHRRDNEWAELLRERNQRFQEAISLREKWRAMLAPFQQVRILWERVRGRLELVEHKRFLVHSAWRWSPSLALLVATVVGFVGALYLQELQIAREVMRSIGHDDFEITPEEAEQFVVLQLSGQRNARRAIQLAASDQAFAARGIWRADQLAWLAAGFTLDNEVDEFVSTLLEDVASGKPSIETVCFVAEIAGRLDVSSSQAEEVADLLRQRLATGDLNEATMAGQAFISLSYQLEDATIREAADLLYARMIAAEADEQARLFELIVGLLSKASDDTSRELGSRLIDFAASGALLHHARFTPAIGLLVQRAKESQIGRLVEAAGEGLTRDGPESQALSNINWILMSLEPSQKLEPRAFPAEEVSAQLTVDADIDYSDFMRARLLARILEQREVQVVIERLAGLLSAADISQLEGLVNVALLFEQRLKASDLRSIEAALANRMEGATEPAERANLVLLRARVNRERANADPQLLEWVQRGLAEGDTHSPVYAIAGFYMSRDLARADLVRIGDLMPILSEVESRRASDGMPFFVGGLKPEDARRLAKSILLFSVTDWRWFGDKEQVMVELVQRIDREQAVRLVLWLGEEFEKDRSLRIGPTLKILCAKIGRDRRVNTAFVSLWRSLARLRERGAIWWSRDLMMGAAALSGASDGRLTVPDYHQPLTSDELLLEMAKWPVLDQESRAVFLRPILERGAVEGLTEEIDPWSILWLFAKWSRQEREKGTLNLDLESLPHFPMIRERPVPSSGRLTPSPAPPPP